MVVSVREGVLDAEDIINLIRGANPNIVIERVSREEDTEDTVELTAQGDTIERLDANVNNLIAMLRDIHPNITIERVPNRELFPVERESLNNNVSEESKKEIDNKRSAHEIR